MQNESLQFVQPKAIINQDVDYDIPLVQSSVNLLLGLSHYK